MAKDETELGDVIKARRVEVAATVHNALGLVLYELGAMDPKPDSNVVGGITWDIVKRMRAPKEKDDPEGRTLARIGKVLEFKTGE